MNIFTKHPQQQGISYGMHMIFALHIAFRLFISVIAFLLHGLLPFIGIQRSLDLEETARFIQEQNQWIEGMKLDKQPIQLTGNNRPRRMASALRLNAWEQQGG